MCLSDVKSKKNQADDGLTSRMVSDVMVRTPIGMISP
jgi:hypothetical protein